MSFKAYEEFKDSNIDWIGPIPNYWQSYKLKHVINEFIAGVLQNLRMMHFGMKIIMAFHGLQ